MMVITRRCASSGSTSATLDRRGTECGSCARIRCSSWRSSPDGSIPSSRARTARSRWKARSASLWRPAAYERPHELAPQAFAQRMLDGQPLQIGDQRHQHAERQSRLVQLLDRGEAQLVESRPHRREAVEIDVGIRLAAPHRERVGESFAEDPWLVRPRLLERRVEHRRIDAHVAQRIPARQRDDVRPAQQLAQLGDVLLHHLAGRRGSGTLPELVDDAVGRDHVRRVGGEQGQQIAQFGSADGQWLTGAEDHERAQHPHLQPRHRPRTYRCCDRPISGWSVADPGRVNSREIPHLSAWEADTQG